MRSRAPGRAGRRERGVHARKALTSSAQSAEPPLSDPAALAAVRDKDVADLVATQSLMSAAGQRLSALTRLAWDNDKLKFDPAASAKASKFELGPPVTWTAKGSDGVDRLGLGFETGMVTHMVDAAGRPAPHVLKRTYKLALMKSDAAHPWLIDAGRAVGTAPLSCRHDARSRRRRPSPPTASA